MFAPNAKSNSFLPTVRRVEDALTKGSVQATVDPRLLHGMVPRARVVLGDRTNNPHNSPTETGSPLEKCTDDRKTVGDEYGDTHRVLLPSSIAGLRSDSSQPPAPTTEVGFNPGEENDLPERTKEEIAKIKARNIDHLVQSAETIKHISDQDYMYLIEQYALYVSDDRYEFDRYTGEPVFIGDVKNEAPRTNITAQANTPEVHRSDAQTDDDDDEDSDSDDDWYGNLSVGSRPPSPVPEGGYWTTKSSATHLVSDAEESDVDGSENEAPTTQARLFIPCSLGKRQRERNTALHGSKAVALHDNSRNPHTSTKCTCAKRKTKAYASNQLSTEYIIERFGMKRKYDVSQALACPFPARDALRNGKCSASLDANSIRSHIADHVKAFKEANCKSKVKRKLECPLRDRGCNWTGDADSSKATDTNNGLARHVADVHYHTSTFVCSCGSTIGRGIRDQILRHLRNGHENYLEKKRNAGENVPPFIDVDDAELVEDEKAWMRTNREDDEDEEDDRGEGSSNGLKRRRL